MEIQGKMRLKESFTPFGMLVIGVLLFGLAVGFLDKAYYQRIPDPQIPVVTAPARKLVDECGVFMWVRWDTPRDPTVDREAPYVPMRERVKAKSTAGRISPQ